MEPDGDGTALGVRLERYLREAHDAPDLTLAAPPEVLGGGFVNHVYAFRLDDGAPAELRGELVLRLAPAGTTPGKLEREHRVQQQVRALGYPTPESLLVEPDESVLGGPFQVMRRAVGVPVVDQLVRRPWVAPARLGSMAELLADLHDLPVDGVDLDGPSAEDRALERLAAHDVPGDEVLGWLRRHRPAPGPPVLVHLDFHAVNVMFDGSRPTAVLDWENVARGDPAHDLADARLVFLVGPTDLPAPLRPVEQGARRLLAARLVGRYRATRGVDADRLRYYTVLAAARRLLGAVLDRPVDGGEATGLTSPEYLTTLAAVITDHTGLVPAYPVD